MFSMQYWRLRLLNQWQAISFSGKPDLLHYFPGTLPAVHSLWASSVVLAQTALLQTTAKILLCKFSRRPFSLRSPQGGSRSGASFPEWLDFSQLVFLAGLPLPQPRAALETAGTAECLAVPRQMLQNKSICQALHFKDT